MLIPDILRCFRTGMLLLMLVTGIPAVRPSHTRSRAVPGLDDAAHYQYGSIFSPLLKALSEHGGSRWNPVLKRKMKPEHKYMKYLTEVYKESSRVQRSLDGDKLYNTVRLIKPQDECLARSNEESYMQDLSYSLDQVRKKEKLLKSALLYNFDHLDSTCYLSIKERDNSDKCQPCPGIRQAVNFTAGTNRPGGRNWAEVDITVLLRPLAQQKIHLLVNITCPDERLAANDGRRGSLEFTVRSPPLLLYLNDTSKGVRHKFPPEESHTPSRAANTFREQMIFKQDEPFKYKRRWKRESPKSKRGDKSPDIHLPELLSSSEYPTSDCALYDFRVRFSQLKLDHWIVFPPKYNPRYCRGVCPRTMGFIYGSPVHTMVQNIIYEKVDSSVPRPSCIPSHYSPLSVMIFEEDGSYVYKEFEDMVATRCTCR